MNKPKSFVQKMLVLTAIVGAASVATAAPATDTWTGNSGISWSSPGNWTGGNAPPHAGDALIFGSIGGTINNDLAPGTAIDGITFNGNVFDLTGAGILLSDTNDVNDFGVFNQSGQAQTIGLNLNLDWGYYTFTSPSGGNIALNGTLTPNLGGVAYFDTSVTSSGSLTLDATTGLISGLEGAGLMYNGEVTGLATISGGSIMAYTGFASVSPGTVGSGNNIALNATGAAAAYTDSGISVNTITALQAGNSGGTATTTLTTTGTLTVGVNSGIGGVYALSGGTTANLLTVTGGAITAGASGVGGTIVYGAVDTTAASFAPNAMAIASSNIDNAGGKVTLIKVGDSSIAIQSGNNTFSGGAYVDQGQLQAGTSWGTGPIYVASGATFFLNNSSTISTGNNFFLSPGTGFAHDNASGTQGALMPGALLLGGSQVSLTGTITCMGSPVSISAAAPVAGDRITGNGTVTYFLNGQITGSGTLDLCSVPHAGQYTLQNQSASPNNWSGGLIIETPLITPSSARTVVVNLGGAQTFTQIPHGAGAGDVLLYSGASAGSFINGSSATFNLNGLNATINGLYGYSLGNVSANMVVENTSPTAATLTVGDNNANGNYGGVMTDSAHLNLSLAKIGTGSQSFTAALNHHGTTTVSQGTMALSGACTITNTSSITVASGAVLDASGTSAGGLTVGAAQSLGGLGSVNGNTTINGTVKPFLATIGTLSNNGNVTLNGGGSYVWEINNAMGTAGGDPGWSVLNVSGTLQINSSSGSPFNIDITSLTTGDVAGNAANFNPNANGQWVIATAGGGVSGFTGSSQFNIVTSGFANAPTSSGQWSVSADSTHLYLNYTAINLITTPLVNTTNNAGSVATFTAASTTGTPPITFTWFQGLNQLVNGGTTSSGASVNIASGGGGTSSTLTIGGSGVEDADAGGFTVNVSDNAGHNASSSATLAVIDPPSNVNVPPPVQTIAPVSAGAVNTLSVSATGGINGVTPDFTYQWYLNGNAISGATSSTLNINVTGATTGNYTVVVSNPAGNVTSSTTTIGSVSVVPDQIVFEPFNYVAQSSTQSGGNPWTATAAGQTNVAGLSQVVSYIYNQLTGVGLLWQQEGAIGQEWTLQQDMRIEPGYTQNYSNYVNFDGAANAPFGDIYPWPGLAGNDPNEMACNSANTDVVLPLGAGGSISNGVVYFSMIMHVDQGSSISQTGPQYFCGFGTGAANSTAFNASIYVNLPGDDTYIPGVFKAGSGVGALSAGVNGNWSGKAYHRGEIVFAVVRLTIGPGTNDDTCDLWLDPNPSTFYAAEGNLPPPDVSAVGGGAPDVGNVDSFYIKSAAAPASRRFTDVRIGRTWASVTPPSAPTLSLADQTVGLGQTVVVFPSQNAGNPAVAYQWQFNGGMPLSDNAHYSGTGTATLTISNVTIADLGVYTVTGVNSDPAPSGQVQFGATYTGSASATLSIAPIPSIAASGSSVIVSWPTNYTGWTLEHTSSLTPSSWSTASLPSPVIVGTNYTVTVSAPGVQQFFRLTK